MQEVIKASGLEGASPAPTPGAVAKGETRIEDNEGSIDPELGQEETTMFRAVAVEGRSQEEESLTKNEFKLMSTPSVCLREGALGAALRITVAFILLVLIVLECKGTPSHNSLAHCRFSVDNHSYFLSVTPADVTRQWLAFVHTRIHASINGCPRRSEEQSCLQKE